MVFLSSKGIDHLFFDTCGLLVKAYSKGELIVFT
ncbi:hypothetical protein SAM_0676, partial [Streptococcus agalactiae CJB111]